MYAVIVSERERIDVKISKKMKKTEQKKSTNDRQQVAMKDNEHVNFMTSNKQCDDDDRGKNKKKLKQNEKNEISFFRNDKYTHRKIVHFVVCYLFK